MRVLVICNFNNHLQSAFLQNLQEVIGEKSVLLAETQTMSSERVDLGWQQSFPSINCVSPFRSESDLVKYRDWVQFADVVISGERMMQEFCEQKSPSTMVFASHNLGQVKRLASRVLYLEYGQLLADFSVDEFFDDKLLKSHCMNAYLFTQGEIS